MERFYSILEKRLVRISNEFKRPLLNEIDWNDRLICIFGARGAGKTTLMLQRIKLNFSRSQAALYVSLDELWFMTNSLTDLAETFIANGGTHLFLDEVHKYPTWSVEIKNLYDNYPELHIVFSGSSIIQIFKGDADLSRRMSKYELEGLSFREYLEMDKKIKFPKVSSEDILSKHYDIAASYTEGIKILPLFREYLREGYYPFFKESRKQYHNRLLSVIAVILESDIPQIEHIIPVNTYKLKKLLGVISESVPYKPNITKLSEQIDSNRNTVLNFIDILSRAKILNGLKVKSKSDSTLAKPEKLYLHNTNLAYALADLAPNIGNIRETFFFNQAGVCNEVHFTPKGDFLLNSETIIEVGGKKKSFDQISTLENSYIAADEIEIGFGKKIPLWLWGFTY